MTTRSATTLVPRAPRFLPAGRHVFQPPFTTVDLALLGRLKIARGSHVEPTADGRWSADLAPVGGPVLGPFSHRSEALAAERQWLETHWLTSVGKR